MKKLLLILVTLLLSTACTNLDKLKKLNIDSGKGFNQALASNYRDFSESINWPNSSHFAKKGLKALSGETVLPEKPEDWDLVSKETNTLKWGRNRLMNVLNDDIRKAYPQKLAKVQSLYDCWIEQHDEGKNMDDANSCRMDFLMELAELEHQLAPPEILGVVTVQNLEAPIISGATQKDIIYFDSGSSSLKSSSQKSIDDMLAKSKQMQEFIIKIAGYTDTVGNSNYNMQLSKARTNAVAARFVEGGVSPTSIEKSSFGEMKPVMLTKDEVAEAKNRRVEVDITGK